MDCFGIFCFLSRPGSRAHFDKSAPTRRKVGVTGVGVKKALAGLTLGRRLRYLGQMWPLKGREGRERKTFGIAAHLCGNFVCVSVSTIFLHLEAHTKTR